MNAEIISVGTELLLGHIVDTHAATMGRILAECGVTCTHRQTVGDNLERVVGAISDAFDRSKIVVTIGGLGPTEDDLTRDAIAKALDDELVHEPSVEEGLRAYMKTRRIEWQDSLRRQAARPSSGRIIANPNGSAPGLICEKNGKVVVALPGPKGEFEPMARGPVREFLATMSGGEKIVSRTLRICGVGESHVEAMLGDLMHSSNPTIAPYAHLGEVHLRLTTKAPQAEAELEIAAMERRIRATLGDLIFGADETTLEAAVLELLKQRNETVATAESITGGGVGERLTSVPGSSGSYLGGVVTYNSDAKRRLLGLDEVLLRAHGPVSRETAAAMASGIRDRLEATFGIGITGNAGPTSDVDGKPVGLVMVAIAGSKGIEISENQYRGTRDDIRRRASQEALVLLRSILLN